MKRVITAALTLLCLTGCAHYKITDTASNKTYYTTEYDTTKTGSLSFKDAVTGSTVNVTSSSEIAKISGDEFEAATAKKKK